MEEKESVVGKSGPDKFVFLNQLQNDLRDRKADLRDAKAIDGTLQALAQALAQEGKYRQILSYLHLQLLSVDGVKMMLCCQVPWTLMWH